MGRSVSTLRNASKVIYVDLSDAYEDEETDSNFTWDDFIEDVYRTFEDYPSLVAVDDSEGENRIILENRLIQVAVSEYCGLASVSLRAIENDYNHKLESFGENFISKIGDKVEEKLKKTYDVYRWQGGFSNGESVYAKID